MDWKKVATMVAAFFTIIGFVTGVIAFDSRYAKEEDAAKTLSEFRSQIAVQNDFNKLDLQDRMIEQYEFIVKNHPSNIEAKDKLERMRQKRERLVESLSKQLNEKEN